MRKTSLVLLIMLAMPVVVGAADLFRVWVTNEQEAAALRETGVCAVVRLPGGYLVLADARSASRLDDSKLTYDLLATGIVTDELAIDKRPGSRGAIAYPLLVEQEQLRIYRVPADIWTRADRDIDLAPIRAGNLPVGYSPPMQYNPRAGKGAADLDSLIGLVNQDSLVACVERLQLFYRRVAGSPSGLAASDWLADKFLSFGYDSVYQDPFSAYVYGEFKVCRNVVAVKVGSRHPEWQIIVGGHFDAVPNSPGADDNGSGTAGVLELARILAGLDTDVTFVFIAFDAEETGLDGAWHYADGAHARGDHIVYMLNMDMIAHITNDTRADLYFADKTAFSELWADLADSLVGITASLAGSSGGSDHYPFGQYGYHVTFVHEYDFSTVYHSPRDSTTYMNFDYMSRMVKASLATVFTVDRLPPPVVITAVIDGGDGQSLQPVWLPMDPERIDHFWLFYGPAGEPAVDSFIVPGTESSALITGLTEDQPYEMYVLPFNADGQSSAEYASVVGTPRSVPAPLTGLAARPAYHGIRVTWHPNTELDIAHYRVKRDWTLLSNLVTDTIFIDSDPALGKNLHSYMAYAVDVDGHVSDTTGTVRPISKAAWMDTGRILAVNRSHVSAGSYLVDETVTGQFLREALAGFDYDYLSDTVHADEEGGSRLGLYDMIDYELVIIGCESARLDDIGQAASMGGRLDSLAYYLAIGGKAILFGRWGELNLALTLPYDQGSPEYPYREYFNIAARNLVLTSSSPATLSSDLIGGHSLNPAYPDLAWDSLATVGHSAPYTEVSGIPCVAYPALEGTGVEILYTYNSSDDGSATEGQPMAWRHLDPDSRYAYFEFPLSFMERDAAVAALSRAVIDFGFAVATTVAAPDTADVWAPPEDEVAVYLGDLTGGHTPADIDLASVRVNDSLTPKAAEIVATYPGFTGEVLKLTMSSSVFGSSYGEILGPGNEETYTVSWQYSDHPEIIRISGNLIVHGYVCGDANTDGALNVGDAIYVINYVFRSGPEPYPYMAGDANGDWGVSVGDAVYLVNLVFKGGDAPACPSQ